ncbi:MAG: flavin reductase family protein [bacterium]
MKVDTHYTDFLPETLKACGSMGILLVGQGFSGKPNTMTIGWCQAGVIWGKPIMTVLVRHSRFTYGLIDEAGTFTVNVMPPEFADSVAFCGKESGRDRDKFVEKGLTAVPGKLISCPVIGEGVIHYECKVVYRDDLTPDGIPSDIQTRFYPQGDFHRVYYGEIVAAYAEENARERLAVEPY